MIKKRTKSQSGSMAKNKGNNNERSVAKLFGNWWSGFEFLRTPSSGGHSRLTKTNQFNTDGDIICSDPEFYLSIECKKVEGWSFEQLFNDKCIIFTWYDQCVNDASKTGKVPMLVFTKNNTPQYVAFDANNYIGQELIKSNISSITYKAKYHLVIVLLKDFMTKYSREDLLNLKKNNLNRALSNVTIVKNIKLTNSSAGTLSSVTQDPININNVTFTSTITKKTK